jgi:4-carboxymuconolactone decarboxylase
MRPVAPITSSERYARGYEKIQAIFGATGTAFIARMQAIHPDFASHIVEYAYGDVMSRKELDLVSRELAIVAALTALGRSPEELEIHIEGALNVGCTPTALAEVIMQMAVYAGFPCAIHGMEALCNVTARLGIPLRP